MLFDKIVSAMSKESEMLKIIYPEPTAVDINKIKIPQDIKTYVDKIENVRRFAHVSGRYPDMIVDNSKAHTIRCVFRAMSLTNSHKDIIRTLWIHDTPEYTDDVDLSAIERYEDHEKAREQEEAERAVAEKVFKGSDYKLFEDFHVAEDFVRRSSSKIPKNQQAILANIIDFIDGNLVSVYFFTKWLEKNEYDGKIPSNSAFTYILDTRERALNAVEKPGVKEDIRDTANYLLNSQIRVVMNLWSAVKDEKIPQVMKQELLKMKTLSNC